YLPANMPYPPTIRKVNPADTPVVLLALTSDTLPQTTVDGYAENILLPKISQITGVGQVGIGGPRQIGRRTRLHSTPTEISTLSLHDALPIYTLPQTTVDAYAENILLPKISQITGVGQVGIGGQR